MDKLYDMLCSLNNALWGDHFTAVIFAACVYLSAKCGFIQLKTGALFKETIGGGDSKRYKAISTALAASMGTGNIIGTAAAVSVGGEGAVFWMAVSAFFGMGAAYCENHLGARLKGSPMSYIRNMPFGKYFSVIYVCACIAAAYFMGNMVQGNAACTAAARLFSADIRVVSAVFAVTAGIIIAGGTERIASAAELLIPPAAALYIIFSLAVLAVNYDKVGSALYDIVTSAFGIGPAAGGAVGYTVRKAVTVGLRRGIFSNEAGMGSSVLVHASCARGDPESAGKWAACEVFIDTVLCCTLTALVIIVSGADRSSDMAAAEAFSLTFGGKGGVFVYLSVIIFAAASMLGWCCYGETALKSLTEKKLFTNVYRALHIAALYIGGVSQMKLLWQAADVCSWVMLTINLSAVIIFFGTEKTKKPFPKKSLKRPL